MRLLRKNTILNIVGICSFLWILSCTNYYNNTIDWMDRIEFKTDLEIVKKYQPNFVKIDWENPKKKGNENWYYITNIKGSNDMLEMSHQLIFINNKFDRVESYK